MKAAILGAGISGLSAARLLKEKGVDVTVYEKETTVGGLARTRFTDGYLYDPYGGHIFNSKHPIVKEWVFNLLSQDKWKFTERNAKIFLNGRYISYPFELSLCELETEDAVNCIHDFILSQYGERPTNYRDWLVWNFGQSICDYYMIPYNEKIWSYPLENMETQWMEGKMPLPDKKDMIRSMLLKDSTERKMPHSTFFYPLEGGIQSLINAMAKGINIYTNTIVTTLARRSDKWIVNKKEEYDYIISTLPLPELKNILKNIPSTIYESMSDLKFNSLTTVLFKCPPTDITWLYIPSHNYRSHRVGYQSALTPNASPIEGEGVGAFEIIGKQFDVTGLEMQNNVLPEELGYIKTLDHEFTKYAYVIFDTNYRKNMAVINNYFSGLEGFELLGRWGRWNYNNMDTCILDSMNLVEKMEV